MDLIQAAKERSEKLRLENEEWIKRLAISLDDQSMEPVGSKWASHVYYHRSHNMLEVSTIKRQKIIYRNVSEEEYSRLKGADSVYTFCCALPDYSVFEYSEGKWTEA